jgi:PAS domain S-box-containing protein
LKIKAKLSVVMSKTKETIGIDNSAIQQLHQYQQRITNILESFTDAFFEVDKNWMVTYWNKEAERLLQVPRHDILGKNLWDSFPEAVILKFYTEYHQAINNNIAVRFEEYYAPQNIWVEVSAFPSGQGLSVYFKDITSHIEATRLLVREKRKYEDLFNFSPIPQWVYDFETLCFLQVNEAAIIHYGYSREEFLSMTIKDIRPKQQLSLLDDILLLKVKAGQFNQSTVQHQKKNGDIIMVIVEGNSVAFEGRSARLVIAIDRTEQVKAEQELHLVLTRYNIVSKATSDTIWDWDIRQGTIYWNNGIKNIFGYNDLQFDVEWGETCVHPDDLQRVRQRFKKLFLNKKSKHVLEYRFRCFNGTYRNVLDRSFIIFDENGEAVRVIGSMQDITERINYIEAIESQNKKLKEITWMQAHDFRAPLARTLALSDLIEMEANDSKEIKKIASMISKSVTEMDEVLKAIIKKYN